MAKFGTAKGCRIVPRHFTSRSHFFWRFWPARSHGARAFCFPGMSLKETPATNQSPIGNRQPLGFPSVAKFVPCKSFPVRKSPNACGLKYVQKMIFGKSCAAFLENWGTLYKIQMGLQKDNARSNSFSPPKIVQLW